MKRALVGAVVSAGVVGATLFGLYDSASAAAEKYALVGPQANIFCSDLTPAAEDVSQTAPGFVVFNANKNKLSTVVSVKDAPPNTKFPIRLIQGGVGGGNDCFTVDGTLTTNANGQGTLNVAEVPTGTRAQVIIDTTVLTGTPTYRGTEIFKFAE
jgi:hypothetical protein